MADGRVVGVETLVRWRHPVDGMVFPDQFIGVSRRTADRRLRVAAPAGAGPSGATRAGLARGDQCMMDNLAALGFADFVAAEALAAGVSPTENVLETESRLMADLQCRWKSSPGCSALPPVDRRFGTGHSSLAQLRDIPFDELKIDQGFVHRAWHNETCGRLDASLGLARQLNMEAIAEARPGRLGFSAAALRSGAGLFHRLADAGGRASGLIALAGAAARPVPAPAEGWTE